VGSLRRVFATAFGIEDFHTHLRLASLEDYVPPTHGRICELGCGAGVASIELLTRHQNALAIGFEESAAALEAGSKMARQLGLEERLTLLRYDLAQGVPDVVGEVDCVLLLDALEHVPAPENLSAGVARRIRSGTRVLVSVPTRLYPRVFGRAYHEHVGHLHEGFALDDLDQWFAGLERVRYRYSTGPMTWAGAALYYRVFASSTGQGPFTLAVRRLAALLSIPFRFLDFWNGKSISCSLFAEYVRP
jgi:SAM-dependent methyltransferase